MYPSVIFSNSPIFNIPAIGLRIHLLPTIAAFCVIFSFCASCMMSMWLNHSLWMWPYVSDVATCAPETSIFSVFMHVGGLAAGLSAYARYKIVQVSYNLCKGHRRRCLLRLANKTSLMMGIAVGTGMSVASNFTETSNSYMHSFGGFMAFGLGAFYWFIQSVIDGCFRVRCFFESGRAQRRLAIVTAFLYLGQASGFSRQLIPLDFWQQLWDIAEFCDNSPDSWQREDYARYHYVVATMAQFISAMLIASLHLDLAGQFRQISTNMKPDGVFLKRRAVLKRKGTDMSLMAKLLLRSEFFMP